MCHHVFTEKEESIVGEGGVRRQVAIAHQFDSLYIVPLLHTRYEVSYYSNAPSKVLQPLNKVKQ